MPTDVTQPAPTVSIITPVYNEMPHLTGTVESALAQDLADFEIILVDDGSTDGSSDELDRLASLDERVIVVHQPNSGWPGAPRNRGLERARGRYVFFLDGDDALEPHALSTMVADMEAEKPGKPPVDIVIPRMRGTGGRKIMPLFHRYPAGEITINRAMETLTPQKMIRRDLIEQHGLRFPEGKVRLEDGIFMTEAYLKARRMAFSGKRALYQFAKHKGSENISSRHFKPEDYVASCRKIAELIQDGVADHDEAISLISAFFGRLGLRFYTPRRWRLAHPGRRRAWVNLHQQFLHDFVPPEADAQHVHPTNREKVTAIRRGDVGQVSALVRTERRLDHTSALASVSTADGPALVVDLESATSRSALGRAAEVILILEGDRSGVEFPLTGELIQHGASRVSVQFLLSDDALQLFDGERVALWTVALMSDGAGSSRIRLRSESTPSGDLKHGRLTRTKAGNISLDLRP